MTAALSSARHRRGAVRRRSAAMAPSEAPRLALRPRGRRSRWTVGARPWPVDIERQMGGVLRFLAGGVRLDRIDPQCPCLGDEIDEAPAIPRSRHGWSSRHARPQRGRCRALTETASLSNAVPPRRMSRLTSIGRRWLRRSASSRLTPTMPPSAASSAAVPDRRRRRRRAKRRRSRARTAPRRALSPSTARNRRPPRRGPRRSARRAR